MTRAHASWFGGLLTAAAFALPFAQGGCADTAGAKCPAGQTVVCSCNGSLTGTSTCDPQGHEGPCDCSGASGSSSGGASSSGAGTSSGGGSGERGDGGEPGDGGGEASAAAVDAAADGASAADGGKKPFGAPCTTAAQCQTGSCQLFQANGGDFCTQPCTNGAQCPNPPGLGCNNMGYCIVP